MAAEVPLRVSQIRLSRHLVGARMTESGLIASCRCSHPWGLGQYYPTGRVVTVTHLVGNRHLEKGKSGFGLMRKATGPRFPALSEGSQDRRAAERCQGRSEIRPREGPWASRGGPARGLESLSQAPGRRQHRADCDERLLAGKRRRMAL